MSTYTILHNPRCSKSRQTLAILEEKGAETEVVKYLEETPSAEEIKAILKKLNISARELMLTKEGEYKKLGLKDEKDKEMLIQEMGGNNKV